MKLLDIQLYEDDLRKTIRNLDLSVLDGRTVAVTGGLGLIGSTIVDLLVAYGKLKNIFVLGRKQNKFEERFRDIKNIQFVPYNALEPNKFSFKVDYIIHGAGIANPVMYVSNPVETILSNFDGVHELLKFSMHNEVKRLLYISSSEVYGVKETEDSLIEGVYGKINIDDIRCSYPIAKCASEMICKAYVSEYGIDTVVVRPGHIYGPSASRSDRRLSSEFAFRAADGENLILKSSGLQKRSYCYSIDCAAQVLTALVKGDCGEVYNIGHDEITSIKKLAELYASAGNVKLICEEPTEKELKEFNPMNNSALNNEKIKSLGYVDTFSVREGVFHTVSILKEMNKRNCEVSYEKGSNYASGI